MVIYRVAWLLPFIAFVGGYWIARSFHGVPEIEVPSLVGIHLHDAVKTLSEKNVNARLLGETEDKELPEGTVLSQIPKSGRTIKPGQQVFLTTSRKPAKPEAPNLVGKRKDAIDKTLKKLGITHRSHLIPSRQNAGVCIAQQPKNGQIVDQNLVVTYISEGNKKQLLLPDLTGLPENEVTEFLHKNCIPHEVTRDSENNNRKSYVIYDQRPLPGSFVNPVDPPLVQLRSKN